MQTPKPNPVDSFENLRARVDRLLRAPKDKAHEEQSELFDGPPEAAHSISHPTKRIDTFIDFLVDALPLGDVYIFGGVISDLALLGRRGFSSDVDLVVEGDWGHCVQYLESQGARQNKFGGYRLFVAGWPVDVWNAQETWAIRQGLVAYKGIGSLTETTVLNWDAILMNWRTRSFVHRKDYLDEIKDRVLHVVLEQNPNPLGMAVRVFRHLCSKDARKITRAAATFLAENANRYKYDVLKNEEIRSYGSSLIAYPVFRFFECLNAAEDEIEIGEQFGIATETVRQELGLAKP